MMIVARELTKRYRSGERALTVLSGIDLTIEPESFVAVLGPSGSGKTTLLGLLAGLDRPTTGTVSLDGQILGDLTEDERARFRAAHVGFVFQTFHLLPTLTALENVMVPIELQRQIRPGRGIGTPDSTREPPSAGSIRDRAAELLARVGLGDRLDHYPAQLSGGEQQRVALARAFAGRPKILFADEPTGNLDSVTGETVIELMRRLNLEARTTLVLVTHDPALADRATRIVRLRDGRIESDERRPRTGS